MSLEGYTEAYRYLPSARKLGSWGQARKGRGTFPSKYILKYFLYHKLLIQKNFRCYMGALSDSFLADAFDKSDGFSRKPKLDTAAVSRKP